MKIKIKELSETEFNQFREAYPKSSIYQTVEYAKTMAQQNYQYYLLGLVDNKRTILAASLVLIEKLHGFKYAYAPRGFLIDYNSYPLLRKFTKEIKKFLSRHQVMGIKLCPPILKCEHDPRYQVKEENTQFDQQLKNLKKLKYHHLGYNFYFEALKPRYEAILRLNGPYYAIFNNFRKQTRTKIRNAVKRGIKIYRGDQKDLEFLYLQTQNKYPRDLKYFQDCYQNFSDHGKIDFFYAKINPATYLKQCQEAYEEQERICGIENQAIIQNASDNPQKLIRQKLNNDQLLDKLHQQLILATMALSERPDGLVIASALVATDQNKVYLFMDGYDERYKAFNAKHLLIWKIIEKYSKLGYQEFNMGGATNPEITDNLYSGLNSFKTGFGAVIEEYIGDFELVTNSLLYFLYRNSAPIRRLKKK